MREAIPPLPHTSAWRGLQLNAGYDFMSWCLINHRTSPLPKSLGTTLYNIYYIIERHIVILTSTSAPELCVNCHHNIIHSLTSTGRRKHKMKFWPFIRRTRHRGAATELQHTAHTDGCLHVTHVSWTLAHRTDWWLSTWGSSQFTCSTPHHRLATVSIRDSNTFIKQLLPLTKMNQCHCHIWLPFNKHRTWAWQLIAYWVVACHLGQKLTSCHFSLCSSNMNIIITEIQERVIYYSVWLCKQREGNTKTDFIRSGMKLWTAFKWFKWGPVADILTREWSWGSIETRNFLTN
jgi:hypothetical protein